MKPSTSSLIATIVATGLQLTAGVSATMPVDAETTGRNPAYREALEIIEQALKTGDAAADSGALRQAADRVARLASTNPLVQQLLTVARTAGDSVMEPATRAALEEAADVLRFQPVEEAPLPEGFPEPTPLGEIRVQRYPAYRLARTPIERGQDQAFWSLFRHIQTHKIAMTAPVEMSYELDGPTGPRGTDMAFLYRSAAQGELGTSDGVEVVDVPAQTVVSLGWRGEITPENIARAGKLLTDWLVRHQAEYERAGELRVMGYNSPMVPVDRRFLEVQIPVRAVP